MTDRDISGPAETIGFGAEPDVDTSGLGVVDGDGADTSSLPMSDPFDGLEAVEQEERFVDWNDVVEHQQALADGRRLDREEAEAEAAAQAERDAKDAEMEAAHERGEAYYWGDTTHDGETVQKWILPDGTTILVNDDGDAVSVSWPADNAPVYQGDIVYEGQVCAVYELPTGAEIVIDSNGTTVGMMDELEPDEIVIPGLDIIIDGYQEGDEAETTVQLVPTGPPGYDTEVVDVETGEVVYTMDTGGTGPGGIATYHPPGADYFYFISPEGEVLQTLPEPVEPEWSVLGIVEYYEDGTVSVDIGIAEFNVDLVGPEKGISVSIDLIIVEGTAGIEWNEDGSWEFVASAEVDVGVLDLEGEIATGVDENGNPYIDVEGSVEMQMGMLELSGEAHAGFQLTDDGFEAYAGASGEMSVFGAYASAGGELTVVSGDEGLTVTGSASVGAGHHALGGWELTGETQFHTDGTWEGSSSTTGVHLGFEMNDDTWDAVGLGVDGEHELGVGVYASTDNGVEVTDGRLDTGRDYEREDAPDEHVAPTGDADFATELTEGEADPAGEAASSDEDGPARLDTQRTERIARSASTDGRDAETPDVRESGRIDADDPEVWKAPANATDWADQGVDEVAEQPAVAGKVSGALQASAATEPDTAALLRDTFDDAVDDGAAARPVDALKVGDAHQVGGVARPVDEPVVELDASSPNVAGRDVVDASLRRGGDGSELGAREVVDEPTLADDIAGVAAPRAPAAPVQTEPAASDLLPAASNPTDAAEPVVAPNGDAMAGADVDAVPDHAVFEPSVEPLFASDLSGEPSEPTLVTLSNEGIADDLGDHALDDAVDDAAP